MSRPARVLLLIDSLTPEAGTENQLIEIIRRMDRTEVELFVGCMEDGERLQALAPYATPLVFPCKRVFSLNGVQQMSRLRRAVKRYSIDIVHTFMIRATIFGVLGAQGGGARVIVTSRRNLGYWYTPRLLWLFRLLNRLVTRVVANSERVRAVAIRSEGLRPDRVDVLRNGVDMTRFGRVADPALASRLGIPRGARVIGIVANYRPVKNLPLFLRAARIVTKSVPDAVFVLVGRGEQCGELKRLAIELGIAHRVVFTDDQGDVAAFYRLFDIGCLSSHSEGLSNVLLEYMAAGLPIVATDVGGVAEAVEHGHTGLVVAEGNERAFAEALVTLLLDPERRAAMGRQGRQRCAELFEIGQIVREYQQYYRQLLDGEIR